MKSKLNKDKTQEPKPDQDEASQQNLKHEVRTVPIIEEKYSIDIQTVEKGKIQITKQVHQEDVHVNVPLIHEEIEVQRISKNLPVEHPPEVRHEGDTMIIPVLKEELVIQKRLVLVEEIHITKRKIEEHQPQQVSLKKEEVKIKKSETE